MEWSKVKDPFHIYWFDVWRQCIMPTLVAARPRDAKWCCILAFRDSILSSLRGELSLSLLNWRFLTKGQFYLYLAWASQKGEAMEVSWKKEVDRDSVMWEIIPLTEWRNQQEQLSILRTIAGTRESRRSRLSRVVMGWCPGKDTCFLRIQTTGHMNA